VSDEDKSKAAKRADAGNGKKAAGKKAAVSVPKASKPSTNQAAKNGMKTAGKDKSGPSTETESDDDKKPDSSETPHVVETDAQNQGPMIQSFFCCNSCFGLLDGYIYHPLH